MIHKRLLSGILSVILIFTITLFTGCPTDSGADDTGNGNNTTVSAVTVSPATANVAKGKTLQFTAAVTGTNSPAQTVTWSVSGGAAGTAISTGGLLTVAAGETATTLTVTATSTVDTGKFGTATVTVSTQGDDGKEEDADGISWASEANGTLTVSNNTSKDMVISQGQTPGASNIMGGVRATSTRVFDVSDDVDDFNVGGFLILRGITLDEYKANKNNLSRAKIEYSAMATYGQGKKYRAEISPNYMGDYGYRVTNLGRIGMELRKDSPDGEKIGYLPSLASNMLLYADNTDGFALYPVFVYYSKSSGQVTTLKPTSQFETVSVSPRPASGSELQAYTLPADQGATWDSIKASLSSPVAYVTITNSVANQSGRVTLAGTNRLKSQNGYDSIGSGEILTYEIQSTKDGTAKAVVVTYYNQALQIPITDAEGKTPVLKNGYDYTITVSGSGQTADGYSVTFTESAEARDLSNDIGSL
jgi:hypothetical protein